MFSEKRASTLHGVLLIVLFSCSAFYIADMTDDGKSKITVPWFAFGFILVIGINSALQASAIIPAETLKSAVGAINMLDNFMLTMAMTALGAETSFDKFKQAGAKPFVLAFVLYVWLLGGGYLMAKYLSPYLQ